MGAGFTGGTFCYQAQLLFHAKRILSRSNTPLPQDMASPTPSKAKGTPSPLIDPTLGQERIRKEAEDPEVALLLLDFILGTTPPRIQLGISSPPFLRSKPRLSSSRSP